MSPTAPVVGILLAGGKSSRMGGGDKCLRPLGGRPILAHIIERLKPQVSDMIVNANGDIGRFAQFDLPVVEDSVGGFAGPLAGVLAGLQWIKKHRPDIAYGVTVATDTPFFPTDLVPRFLARPGNRPALLVARSAEGVHPVIGLWPVALADNIEDSLKRGLRKVGGFAERHGAIEVPFPPVKIGGEQIDPFFNINRPEDLAAAEALMTEHTTPPVFGVVGWKNSGKTTLMIGLIGQLTRRGFAVSVIKHAHAKFEIDHEGRDSYKMREAGACQVALSSPRRFALMRELGDSPEMAFAEILAYAGKCDLVLVEGYKREAFPKIEIRRDGAASREKLQGSFPQIVAIASDRPKVEDDALPVFDLNDVKSIADFVVAKVGLRRK